MERTTTARPHRRTRRLVWRWRDADSEELIRGVRNRDSHAQQELIVRESGAVWRSLYRLNLSPQLREDAYVATWEVALKKIDQLRDPSRIRGWLATIARREALDLQNHDGRLVLYEEIEGRMAHQSSVADERLLDEELVAAVVDAISRLSPREQEFLRLRVCVDSPRTYAEIADQLGCTHGSIGPTLMRIIEKIRNDRAVWRFFD